MVRAADLDFDFPLFWSHVKEYVKRWNLHILDLSDMIDIDYQSLRYRYLYDKSCSINTICRLAQVCDLDLNKYNKAKVLT